MSTPSVLKMMMVSAISNVLVVNDDISDTEPFEVALVKTTYTVDESVGSVSVCVNFTRPETDILDETVNVFVIDYPSSVYVPPGAPLASESDKEYSIRFVKSYFWQPQILPTFSVSI